MLLQLEIENLALIEKLSLNFGQGLNVFTGETGAGKSILIDAVNLLVGERASTEQVRTGTLKAYVSGLFDCSNIEQIASKLEENGLSVSDDQSLLLTREIIKEGKSTCRVNGRLVSLTVYRMIGDLLVDLHGQHEHQSLMKVDSHRELLDAFGGEVIAKQLEVVAESYRNMIVLQKELKHYSKHQNEIDRRIAYLQDILTELDALNPLPGEEKELEQQKERFNHLEKLMELVNTTLLEVYDGTESLMPAYDLLSRSLSRIQEMSRIDPSGEETAAVFEGVLFKLEDAVSFLRSYMEKLVFDPNQVQEVEERLFQLRRLMRKYEKDSKELCSYRCEVAAELVHLQENYKYSHDVADAYTAACKKYQQDAALLSELRRQGADLFNEVVEKELHLLGMEKAKFAILWRKNEQAAPWGWDLPEYIFSPNPGEPLKPLEKIASGGELSRVMLALKVILAARDAVPTLVFDEIDTGIGGRTLQIVADRLEKLGSYKQVLCVTHSPQIAGRGRTHYYIEKIIEGERTRTTTRLLEGEEKINEITRMLGGCEEDKVTRLHAEQILSKKEDE